MAAPTPYPRILLDFQRAFPDDAACARYLVERRWPNGFIRPRCGSSDVSLIATRGLWQCRPRHHHTSITASTVLHHTKLPLTTWFWAAYLAATLTPGISDQSPGRRGKATGLTRLSQKTRPAAVLAQPQGIQ